MNVRLEGVSGRATLHGSLRLPSSKSELQRRLLIAALADGPSRFDGAPSEFETPASDLCDALRVVDALGARVEITPSSLELFPGDHDDRESIEIEASATALRLSIPLLLTRNHPFTITGSAQLAHRSIDAYRRCFSSTQDPQPLLDAPQGLSLPLQLCGPLHPGAFALDASHSSQFASGMTLALPLLDGPSTLELLGQLPSLGYFALTARCLSEASVALPQELQHLGSGHTLQTPCKLAFKGCSRFKAVSKTLEPDRSLAAFWQIARAIQGDDSLSLGFDESSPSLQPDARVGEILKAKPALIDCAEIPDQLPPLAVWASVCAGHVTRFDHAARLKGKESDRFSGTAKLLEALGVRVAISADQLAVYPIEAFNGATLSSNGDHRMVFAAVLASLAARQPIMLQDAEAVSKSYAPFWRDFMALGGHATLV